MTLAPPPRQRGRPSKAAKPGEKTTLSLRVTPELKARLEEAGAVDGRNLSQEAERRLENSFRDEQAVEQALEFAWGAQLAGMILLIGDVLSKVGMSAALYKKPVAGWLHDPWLFDQAAQAANRVLEACRPAGPVERPPEPDLSRAGVPPETASAMVRVHQDIGNVWADLLLGGIQASDRHDDGLDPKSARRRAQLGDLVRANWKFKHKPAPSRKGQDNG